MDDVLGWLDEVSGSGPSSAGAAASQPSVEAPSAQPSVLCLPTSVTQATTAASNSRQAPAPPPSHPVAFGSRHPEKESDHYVHNTIDLYASDITEPLKKIREIRGPLLEELTMASGCTGTGPESLLPAITALDVRHEFTCDLKSSAWLFIKNNCDIGDKCHHYLDLNALLADARCVDASGNEVDPSSPLKVGTHISGRCARHEMDVCGHFIAKTALDGCFAGISCKPYSLARTGRRSGTKAHADATLLETFVLIMGMLEPVYAMLENVWGFCLPESKLSKQSPLMRLMLFAERYAPQFLPVVVIMQGTTFMHFTRRRVYVTFFNIERGGREAARNFTLFVVEHLIYVYSVTYTCLLAYFLTYVFTYLLTCL